LSNVNAAHDVLNRPVGLLKLNTAIVIVTSGTNKYSHPPTVTIHSAMVPGRVGLRLV